MWRGTRFSGCSGVAHDMDTVADILSLGMTPALMWGFFLGFVVCAFIYAIRAVVHIVKRLWR